MMDDEQYTGLRERYRNFAEIETRGSSALYSEMAARVSQSEALLRLIARLPPAKQQPNLVFAATRRLFGTPADAADFERTLLAHPEPIRALILARSTQSNEPGRCATLLPAMARLPEPLAIIEVGASAGLCLLPDRYAYDYGRASLRPDGAGPDTPVFPCRASSDTPLPERMPRIVWRAGLDLSPVDLGDEEDVAWLQTLVWPGDDARAERLGQAVAVARRDPPEVVRGDLVDDLAALAARAPRDVTLVVFHTAVLAYVDAQKRDRFARLVARLGAVWISNESADVLPRVAARLRTAPPPGHSVLAVNGEPVAVTHMHGLSIDWLA
ncbi:MAG TPA: DUF2332 domain-containing protein [Longimicrobium sp.]